MCKYHAHDDFPAKEKAVGFVFLQSFFVLLRDFFGSYDKHKGNYVSQQQNLLIRWIF